MKGLRWSLRSTPRAHGRSTTLVGATTGAEVTEHERVGMLLWSCRGVSGRHLGPLWVKASLADLRETTGRVRQDISSFCHRRDVYPERV
jgi:hypothetical protein